MKLEAKKLSIKRTESQKMTNNKDQKVIQECAQQLRKIGDLFNIKCILAEKRAKKYLSEQKVK